MRFKLLFELENEVIPIQYRKNFISFFKLALENYDVNYFNKFYHEKDNIIKNYTFAVYLKNAKFNQETITISGKNVILNFSTPDTESAVIFYNAFNNQIHKKIPMNKNSMTLVNISMLPEKKILEDNIMIKFISPLVVHYRNQETKKDHFYSFDDEEFLEMLKMNIKNQLQGSNELINLLNELTILPINAKKMIVKFYEKKIETSSGIFQVHADKNLLKYLYQAGMGSKRSAGFGMFEII